MKEKQVKLNRNINGLMAQIETYRQLKNISQTDLAMGASISRKQYYEYCRGANMSLGNLERITDYLGLKITISL